ncbi:MAG: uroporphyrinogen decarboxylase family protein [Bacteroidota bacterium]
MKSRERVEKAIKHQDPDKIPIDFGGHRSSGIMAIAYARLKEELGIKTGDIYVYDMIQQLAIIEPPVLEMFGADTIELGRGFLTGDADWKDWVLPDGTPCKIPYYINVQKEGEDWILTNDNGKELGRQKKGCLYFEQTHYPWAEVDFENASFNEMESVLGESMWTAVPHPGAHLPLDNEGCKTLFNGSKKLRESTDKAIIGIFGGAMFEVPQYLVGSENFFMYLAMYPDAIHCFQEKLCNIYERNIEKWLNSVGSYIDIILFGGDDLGTNNGPMISPEMYREFIKPYHKRLWTRAKELADVKVQLHCCGGIEPLLDDMIDAGLDMINPVQISAHGMDAGELKSKYGDRICFWGGGCDTQHVLDKEAPGELEKHITSLIDTWGNGNGYVFQQVHNIMANVPPKNIVRLFETIDKIR